jgi:DUF1680 family protein
MRAGRLALHGDTRYVDPVERAFYNAVAAGALERARSSSTRTRWQRRRAAPRPWAGTARCPPNLARVTATVGGWRVRDVHARPLREPVSAGHVVATVAGGPARVDVETDYP